MKNKYIFFFLLTLCGSILVQCKSNKEVEPIEPEVIIKVDFNAGAIKIMDQLSDQLKGKWNLQQVEFDIKYTNPTGSIKKDTIFTDFAVLEVHSITRNEDLRYPLCKGEITYLNQSWPVVFRLLASPERIVEKKGPQAFMLLEWQFSTGTHIWKPEELFFRDLGLIGENYSIEVEDGKMLWKGLNRDIKQIQMKKI